MKSKNWIYPFVMMGVLLMFTSNNTFGQGSSNKVTDIDGNVYHTITIGTQVWMVENLKVTHYRNGELIPQVQERGDSLFHYDKLYTSAWFYYENNPENGKIYGKLYNWYAVNDPRGLAPKGWHIPSDSEWTKLTDFLGSEKVAGGKLKATILWESPNEGATNESGFSVLPAGVRNGNGSFDLLGKISLFWSSTEEEYDLTRATAWLRTLNYRSSFVSRTGYYKVGGFSVRCVRD